MCWVPAAHTVPARVAAIDMAGCLVLLIIKLGKWQAVKLVRPRANGRSGDEMFGVVLWLLC